MGFDHPHRQWHIYQHRAASREQASALPIHTDFQARKRPQRVPGPSPFTIVQDAVSWLAPPPPIQLLLLHVPQAPVVENHPHHTLGAQEGTAHRSEGAWAPGNQFPQLGSANHPTFLTPTLLPTLSGHKHLDHKVYVQMPTCHSLAMTLGK